MSEQGTSTDVPRERRRRGRIEANPVTVLVQSHLRMVEQVVSALSSNWPRHLDRGELVSAGRLGLVQAAQKWDSSRDVDFASFARPRVRGAILDLLRGLDWAPRRVRAEERQLDVAAERLTAELGRAPTLEELADATDVAPDRLRRVRAESHVSTVLSLDAPMSGDGDDEATFAELLMSPRHPAERRLEDVELRNMLADALHLLDQRSRRVIVGYFLEGATSEQLADELGVSVSRISQIRTGTLSTLNDVLEAQWDSVRAHEPSLTAQERRAHDYATAVARYRTWRQRLEEPAARSATWA